MKVLITGGAGYIGRATTERLIALGWDVRVVGLETEIDVPGAEVVTCDLMNYDDLREQMRGCQAVIHLAAIRGPQLAPGHTIFQVNAAGTFNVFEAAATEGISRVVQASSINALGCAYNIGDFAPQYLPIDEAHPSMTNDPYSFSKEVVEDVGRYYWRREGISSVAMRFPAVTPADWVGGEVFRERRQAGRDMLDELAALPEGERQQRMADVRTRVLDYRGQRPLEFKDGKQSSGVKRDPNDSLWYAYMVDRYNLWAVLDVRDAAQSLEKGVTASYDGAHALYINDHCNWLDYDAETIARFFFPDVRKIALTGSQALVSIDKARKLIGFEPEYSVDRWTEPSSMEKPA